VPPINCDTYDYLEIACLYHYDIEVIMRNKILIRGKALNVGVVILHDVKQECLLVEQEDKRQLWLATSDLLNLHVITLNPQFTDVSF
jgi:Rho-binding antiterminator